jgi:hypothetical protein
MELLVKPEILTSYIQGDPKKRELLKNKKNKN